MTPNPLHGAIDETQSGGDAQTAVTPQAADPRATGAEQAEVERKLHEPGGRCECDELGEVAASRLHLYNAVTERPFVNHAPDQCQCTNDLALYRRPDGSEKWLCSCCWFSSDERLSP